MLAATERASDRHVVGGRGLGVAQLVAVSLQLIQLPVDVGRGSGSVMAEVLAANDPG